MVRTLAYAPGRLIDVHEAEGTAGDETPFTGDPGGVPLFDGADANPGGRALLIHGTSDTVVGVEHSSGASDRLAGLGWSVRLRQEDTDHAGVLGAVYDPGRRRCVPTPDPQRRNIRAEVATLVARMTST